MELDRRPCERALPGPERGPRGRPGAVVAALVVANSGEVMATALAVAAGVREIDARRGGDGWQRAERQ